MLGLLSGEKITDYLVVSDQLGVGGFADVYAVKNALEVAEPKAPARRQQTVMTTLAAKIFCQSVDFTTTLLGPLASYPIAASEILIELDLALGVRHDHCTRSFAAGQAVIGGKQRLFLLMEVAEGSLRSLLESGSRPDVAGALLMAQHIAEALCYCHRMPNGASFVHRDVKPGNVLYFKRSGAQPDDEVCWKLADFGISKRVSGDDSKTITGLLKGTPAYMPPEAFRGVTEPAWDVWSLGVTLAETLGRKPFRGDAGRTIEVSIQEDEPLLPKNVPPRVTEILRGCLQKDPSQRWTMEMVLDEIRHYRTGLTVERILTELRKPQAPVPARVASAKSLAVPYPWILTVLITLVLIAILVWILKLQK